MSEQDGGVKLEEMKALPPAIKVATPVRALRATFVVFALIAGGGTPLAAEPSVTTTHFQFFAHGHEETGAVSRLAEEAEALVDLVELFTSVPVVGEPLRIHTYATIEGKGLSTGYMRPAHSFSGRGELHVAREDGFDGDFEYELAVLLLRRTLGKARLDALESGLAVWVGPGRENALHQAGRIAAADRSDGLEFLLSNRAFHGESYLVRRFVSCALVGYLIETWGKEIFLERYREWSGGRGETGNFRAYLSSLRPAKIKSAPFAEVAAFQRGFCHAHEGYNIVDGYGSRRSDEALAKLASLGTNAVSVTPFTYVRRPDRPDRFPFSNGTRSENDESIIHAARTAHRLGMMVMLKPHVWVTGSWPGAIEMKNETDWNRFFDYYYRWIRHYALIAAQHHIEILCIGTELSKTTVGHESRWIDMIARLREIYDGQLTYAANWGGEFENVSFWSSLDYIGVNCYYPLSDESEPSDGQLERGVDGALSRIEGVAQHHGKPALITEVGFASAPTPWAAPYERRRGALVDQAAQARCYETFFRGLVGRSRIVGVYWWKWPSFLEYGGPRHAGFTPNGKEAEEVVRRWYGGVFAEDR